MKNEEKESLKINAEAAAGQTQPNGVIAQALNNKIDMEDNGKNIKKPRAKTYRYKSGDIFSVSFDDGTFGYGIIIAKIVPMKKMGLISQYHPFQYLGSMPILVRTFDLITENDHITLNELADISYKSTHIIMDWCVHRGLYPLVLYRDLLPEDIDFPVYFGVYGNHCNHYTSRNQIFYDLQNNQDYENIRAYFSWGFGLIEKQGKEFENNLPDFETFRYGPCVSGGLSKENFLYQRFQPKDFPEVLEYFGLPSEIEFDDFNEKYNGYTKSEFVEILKTVK
ncbi:MAG: immunity 26/phosphotriesterase HocA family protein [Helicobacteraceae bacterium]|jgi:hypothetical protein|nr:immunity 26/phosphotriesterase HocA family protein [Helicobacteraceae bacterium]